MQLPLPGQPQGALPPGAHAWEGRAPPAANDERFRHLVEEYPAITWTSDPEGHVTYVNPRLREYIGADPSPNAHEWASVFLHPDDIPVRDAAWQKANREGIPYEVEIRIRGHDGIHRWFLARAKPVRDERGRIVEWLGTASDIDALKRYEGNLRFLADAGLALAELADVDQTLERIANMAVPFFADWCEIALRTGGVVRRLAAIHGDPRQMRLLESIDERFPRVEGAGAARVLSTGETIFIPHVADSALQEAASTPEHLEMLRQLHLRSFICAPMATKDGVIGAITFATAESGRTYGPLESRVADELARRAGVALDNARLMQALTDADRRKDEFLAVLAHELRNPLAPVRNAVEILRASPSPSPRLQWTHDVIDRQVRQMARLVDDLLDVSRIARGKITLKRERVDLADVIRLALETSRPLIERSGHEFTLRSKPSRLVVDGDLARLAQVVANLLNNAARYTPPGGHIWLEAGRRGSQVEICVGDNGIGIEPHLHERIFELFGQGGENDRSQGGLGIGLTLVKRLVEMHGGTVEVRSPGTGRGSEFIVRLPAALDERVAHAGERIAFSTPALVQPRRVLVVDDNRDAADSLTMLLVSKGHEVRVAYDGLEAVGSAIAFDPDVLLMDIGLPKLDGYEAARQIRQAKGDAMLLVAITGWGQDEDRRRAREAGFNHHLTKPVDPEAIARLIETAPPRG